MEINWENVKDYTSLTRKEVEDLGVKYPLLTEEEVLKLNNGDLVFVLWTGGNGPHKNIVTDRCWVNAMNEKGDPIGTGNALDFVGSEKPYTMVWKVIE